MKKFFSIVLLIAAGITYAQKKTNGTIYVEHPAINLVEAMTQAYVKGDADKVASFLADDFKSYNGTSSNKDWDLNVSLHHKNTQQATIQQVKI